MGCGDIKQRVRMEDKEIRLGQAVIRHILKRSGYLGRKQTLVSLTTCTFILNLQASSRVKFHSVAVINISNYYKNARSNIHA
jgi:hypothetical protein